MDNKKIWDIVNDDLGAICFSLEKIRATAISAHSYLDNMICEPDEQINAILCMFNVIEDLTKMADNQLSNTADKLCVIYKESGATK